MHTYCKTQTQAFPSACISRRLEQYPLKEQLHNVLKGREKYNNFLNLTTSNDFPINESEMGRKQLCMMHCALGVEVGCKNRTKNFNFSHVLPT